MLFHNATADEQAQPHAGELAIVNIPSAVEAFEDMRQIVRRDANALIGDQTVTLRNAPQIAPGAKTELGIRPEFVRLGREGMPVTITKIEDIGRNKIVRATFAGLPLTAALEEDDEIPADPRVTFDPAAISIYADSWRVKTEG